MIKTKLIAMYDNAVRTMSMLIASRALGKNTLTGCPTVADYGNQLPAALALQAALDTLIQSAHEKKLNPGLLLHTIDNIIDRYPFILAGKTRSDTADKEAKLLSELFLRLASTIRDTRDQNEDEYSAVSYLEHRIRTALTERINHKTPQPVDPHTLSTYTLPELTALARKTGADIPAALNNRPALDTRFLNRCIENYSKQIQIDTIVRHHHLHDSQQIKHLQVLTYDAATLLINLPRQVQQDLIEKINNNQGHIWNSAFIRGYYYLHYHLHQSPRRDFLLSDLTFPDSNQGNRMIFKETLYEALGQFIRIEHGQFITPMGLDNYAHILSRSNKVSEIKGIFGELITAYYYTKAYDMHILEFGRHIKEGTETIGEIDILALDPEHVLHDIEVKNWSLIGHKPARKVKQKILEQMLNPIRRDYLAQQVIPEYEQKRGIRIQKIQMHASIVSETDQADYLKTRLYDHQIKADIVPLVPDWLNKGMYDPAPKQKTTDTPFRKRIIHAERIKKRDYPA